MEKNIAIFEKVRLLFQRITLHQDGTANFFEECLFWELSEFPEALKKIKAQKLFQFFSSHKNPRLEEFNKKFAL